MRNVCSWNKSQAATDFFIVPKRWHYSGRRRCRNFFSRKFSHIYDGMPTDQIIMAAGGNLYYCIPE